MAVGDRIERAWKKRGARHHGGLACASTARKTWQDWVQDARSRNKRSAFRPFVAQGHSGAMRRAYCAQIGVAVRA
jgi:hypothetical protein